jgi:hypothetical protein
MHFRLLKSSLLACVLALYCAVVGAPAGAALKTVASNGLSSSLLRVVVKDNEIVPEIVVKNTRDVRVYVLDAQFDNSQRGFLGSGQQTAAPNPSGIPVCVSDIANCIAQYPNIINDLAHFGYIEPGGSLPISLDYSNLQLQADDTFSFSLALVARLAKKDRPDEAYPAIALRFSFSDIPVIRK